MPDPPVDESPSGVAHEGLQRDDAPEFSGSRRALLAADHSRRSPWESDAATRGPSATVRYPDSWYRHGRVQDEVKRMVDSQVDWLREMDTKAMRTVRFNAVLLGLLVPVATFAVESWLVGSTDAFYNPHVGFGVAALVASAALAGVTYTATSLDVGVSSDDVRSAHRRELTDRLVHDTLVASYVGWIQSNRRILAVNSLLVTATIVLMVHGLALLALGGAIAVFGEVPTIVRHSTYLGLGAITVVSRLL